MKGRYCDEPGYTCNDMFDKKKCSSEITISSQTWIFGIFPIPDFSSQKDLPPPCTFEECLTHAKIENADGFSYGYGTCTMCTASDLAALKRSYSQEGVYKKIGTCTFITTLHYYLNPCLEII